jgi:hypothetical protein
VTPGRLLLVLLPSAMLGVVGCGKCTPDMALEHPEGFLGGYSDLMCELWDYDSGVIVFSYRLPDGIQPEEALAALEMQASRSMWRNGTAQPPQSCYERRVSRPGYLLTVCETPGLGSPWAWEFVVTDSRVRVTTGGARYVLNYFLTKE